MLSTILQHPASLVAFVALFELTLHQPQMRHLLNVADALLVCPGKKTLSNLYRQLSGEPDPKTAADYFRESGWQREDIGQGRKKALLVRLLGFAQQLGLTQIMVSVDDSTGKKNKATRHLEAVCFHHDHQESSRKKPKYVNGFVYVEVHIQVGPIGFTFDTRLYLRDDVVRKLNRQRLPGQRLAYRSKYALAKAMLAELSTWLPKTYAVYVLCDSWYSSTKLINFCRHQGWHVISALKCNRGLDQKQIRFHDQALRHTPYHRVELLALHAPRPAPVYYVRTVTGHLKGVAGTVRAIISRRHKGEPRPKYFLCTDLSLSAQAALRLYQRRWSVEVDNFYLKEGLGLADFRLQSFEATDKWFAVTLVSLNYLQDLQAQSYVTTGHLPSLADMMRQHRSYHLENVIRRIATEAAQTGQVEEVLRRYLPSPTWAVV